MSAALSSNNAAEIHLIRCHCLAQGRRKFSEVDAGFPAERAVVVEALKRVYEHAEEARDQQLSAQARFTDQQTYSTPSMDALKTGLEQQTEARRGEPHSCQGSRHRAQFFR
jgi:hypothetical protein